MKKINVNKNDEPALIAEKIIDAADDEIILTIPRFSHIGESLANFHLLKREAEAVGKKLIIESVDDHVVELAGISGIDSINPFFTKSRKQFSDIVVPVSKPKPKKKKAGPEEKPPLVSRKKNLPKISFAAGAKKATVWGGGAALLVLGVFLAVAVLPRAEITILTKKLTWTYKDSVIADKTLAVADISSQLVKIPGQFFAQKSNLSLSFTATGKKQVEQKAGGTIIIYNAYSSDPQPLVINTRFEAPDGKIFRLTKGITVAGAKIVDGKIVPSTTEAQVVADKAGESYNIGPVARFNIPGFKGTAKYAAFYGESKEPMKGGFIGELAYPTAEDITKAKNETAGQLENSLKLAVTAQIPPEFKVLPGASQFTIAKHEVVTEVDESGKFSVLTTGELNVMAFRESSLAEAFSNKGRRQVGEDFIIKDYELKYLGEARLDLTAGRVSFPAEFAGVYWPELAVSELKEQFQGKTEFELKDLILNLSNVESAKVSLWPFWVSRIPNKENKITVGLE